MRDSHRFYKAIWAASEAMRVAADAISKEWEDDARDCRFGRPVSRNRDERGCEGDERQCEQSSRD
jgi:hypothetical protein